ncbi:unnamed protein product [Ostreobium quekettii]|uniref:S5 DRBM domain-containing protein n=1 Tax=Ostreobium quekettii TaxID=121088 RepID=A0A8S1JD82_9CHLO|nr:unnamed protein product [Ostreobium quekettii]
MKTVTIWGWICYAPLVTLSQALQPPVSPQGRSIQGPCFYGPQVEWRSRQEVCRPPARCFADVGGSGEDGFEGSMPKATAAAIQGLHPPDSPEASRGAEEEDDDDDDDDGDGEGDGDDDDESVSVLDQYTGRDGYVTSELLRGEGADEHGGGSEGGVGSEREEEVEEDLDTGAQMFREFLQAPARQRRHLLRDLLSPKILGDEKPTGLDRADLVDEEHMYNFLVDIRLSQKAVKSGRITRYRSMMVVGDLKGLVGYGYGKSSTVHGAVERARRRALKDLIYIPRYREHTIYAPSEATVTETKVMLWPRPRGFGVVANDMLFQVCELIGLMDVSIKVLGRKNRFNTIKALFEALEKIPTPLEQAEEQGVYMRERACLPKKRLQSLLGTGRAL